MLRILYLSCFLFLFLSCSQSKTTTSSSSVRASSYSYESNNNSVSPPRDPASDRFIVAPEIATISAVINATAGSFDETAELLTTNSKKLINSVTKIEGCSANIIDYQHPVAYNSRKIATSDSQKYSGNMELEISANFAQAKDITARIKQLNSCLQAIPRLQVEDSPEEKDKSINLSVSKAMPTVKNAGKHRQQLLKAKFVALKELTNLTEPANQFKASDIACTSLGNVNVVDRSLSGIELDIDLDCHRLVNNKVINIPEK